MGRFRLFFSGESGNVTIAFAFSLVPITLFIGAATDYSAAVSARTALQGAVDAGALAGASATSNQASVAQAYTSNNINNSRILNPSVSSTRNADASVTVSATAQVLTTFMTIAGVRSIAIGATATASAGRPADTSCILTLDKGNSTSNVSLTLNGAPNINLAGCTIRSNTSMTCNGHSGNSLASIATGTASGCNNPQTGVASVPDIYSSLATNISTQCGSGLTLGAIWVPGLPPIAPKMITIGKSGYTEYHVCGTLTVSGTGYLTGNTPTTDSIIVIENGDLIVSSGAVINASRTAIVFTGDNSVSGSVTFPNGKGQGATFAISPPISATNPWRGIALYQDPKLTNTSSDWGPGATLNADGVVYMPHASLTIRGNSNSNNSNCTKLVVGSFTSNGSVNLNFGQSSGGCAAIGLSQYAGVPLSLIR